MSDPPASRDHHPPARTGLRWAREANGLRYRRYRVGSEYSFPPHAHCSPGLVLGLEGRFTAVMDGIPFHVEPDRVLVLPPGEVHWEAAGALGARCLLIEPLRASEWRGRWVQPRAARVPGIGHHIQGLASRGDTLRSRNEIAQLVLRLRTSRQTWPAWARDAWARVEAHPDGWTVQSLARAVRVAPETLCRGFVAFFGTTPSAALRDNRLERAARQVVSASTSLSGVAFDCGFSDQSHFTHRFVERFGVSPGALRRRARAERR